MKDVKYYQELADRVVTAYPVGMELEVRIGDIDDNNQGEFFIESWEGADPGEEVPAPKMVIEMADLKDMSREEMEHLLTFQIFIHELGHALQYRSDEYEEEREGDHDAEWGVKYSQVYEFLMSPGLNEPTVEERDKILGLTKESKELIISNLADAISRDMENESNE